MRFGRALPTGAPAATFFDSSTAYPLSRSTDLFLVRHIGPKILKVDLKLAVLELSGQLVHGTRGRPKDVLPVSFELTAMAWTNKLVVAGLPRDAATQVRADCR